MTYSQSKKAGFTLIEILVVLAIVAALTVVVRISLGDVIQQSRDERRYTDLESVRLALHLYQSENDAYPDTSGAWWTVCVNGNDTTARDVTGGSAYIPDLAPRFMAEVPVDPTECDDPGDYHGYVYRSDGQDYKFATDWSAEIGEKCQLGERYEDPSRTTADDHTFCSIYSEGAASW